MIFEKIRNILCDQLDLEENNISMNSSIADDLGADSLDVIDLIMSIEEEFDIEFQDDHVDKIKTVGDVVRYLEDQGVC